MTVSSARRFMIIVYAFANQLPFPLFCLKRFYKYQFIKNLIQISIINITVIKNILR